MEFKDLIIKRPKTCRMPSLDLNGKWLHELGFAIGVMVSVTYNDSCLTLNTHSNGSTIGNHSHMLVVESKRVHGRTRPQLILNGFILKKYGFGAGDRVGLHLMQNQIQLTKINRLVRQETA